MTRRILALGLIACGACLGGGPASTGSSLQLEEQGGGGDDGGACASPHSQGYWKNHEEAWPSGAILLGSVEYSHAKLATIFRTPVRGNGIVSLAHQLAAAKLNVANGAPDAAADAIADADAMIGALVVPPFGDGSLATSDASPLVEALDDYNNDRLAGACPDLPLDVQAAPIINWEIGN